MSIAELAAEAFAGTCSRPLTVNGPSGQVRLNWPALFKLTNRPGTNLLDFVLQELVQLAFESLLSAHQHVSAPSNVSRSLFAAPLFSQPYELLFPQALCFDNHLNCPGVWGCDASCGILPIQQSESQATPFQQLADSCTLFALFLRPAFFVFSNFQTLFVKHRGWGIPSQIPYRTAYPCLLCEPPRSLRLALSFGPFRYTSHSRFLSTFNCRLSTSLP
jgi:hypothetical protein